MDKQYEVHKKDWAKSSKENWITAKIWRVTVPILVKLVKKTKLSRGEVMDTALREFADKREIKV
jgi:hypothetical protein